MASSIKLSDDVMALVRHEAELQSRSVAGQITHWLRIGRSIERSGHYDHARISAALEGQLDTTALQSEEEAGWLDALTDKMAMPCEEEKAFYAKRQRLGRGVGLDEGGNLVHARAASKA
ncbi:hypothetical protein V8J36_22740 [Frigidibacter sp. MR17.14]|uniref:TA system antitoxin ParD family protein n=1 Tax=Frigidibacter sp. MR17.14 TaxID=3126509 RepID=UPI003012F82A